ncbi:hypothetical protein [Chryseobacterium culicis]|jgi:hypothetical protein|uniref:C1q domain-containing protein n=1 Tax=Chryseobacterium culicis TaxID=680127 RepID=A0A1H6H784_CHRCI|nr:hypothetical protein [Chryseobacterium culicis]SEH31639.1 hypothetical protein SAMN05421593_1510 [Chryseobacterium culicis]
MKKLILPLALLGYTLTYAQVGIQTSTPQKTLHVNGSLQVVNELNVGGNASTAGTAGTAGQVLTSNGPGAAPTWNTSPAGNYLPTDTGTVLVLNGQPSVADEITVSLSKDIPLFTATNGLNIPFALQYLTSEIIDNKNTFTGLATTNTFTVQTDGIYIISMNFSVQSTAGVSTGNLRFGIVDAVTSNWVTYSLQTLPSLQAGDLINLSSERAAHLVPGVTYQFAAVRNQGASGTLTMRGTEATDNTNNLPLPISLFSVKRIK